MNSNSTFLDKISHQWTSTMSYTPSAKKRVFRALGKEILLEDNLINNLIEFSLNQGGVEKFDEFFAPWHFNLSEEWTEIISSERRLVLRDKKIEDILGS